MTTVYLLRHGATAANLARPYRLQGRGSNPPLDAIGARQSRLAAHALIDRPLVAVYSSTLLRALETARIVGRPHGLEPVAVADLTEADVGRWEGLTWDLAQARDPEHFDRFHARPGVVPYPDGESFLDVQRRVEPAVTALAADHPGAEIAVIGHNVVNRALLAALLGLPIDRARALRQANGGINVIEYENSRAELITFNSCFHLAVDEPPPSVVSRADRARVFGSPWIGSDGPPPFAYLLSDPQPESVSPPCEGGVRGGGPSVEPRTPPAPPLQGGES